MIACKNSSHEVDDDFREVRKIVKVSTTTKKDMEIRDKILDFMGSEELIANLFRISQTESKLNRENIQGVTAAGDAHYKVGREVRSAIERVGGVMPEDLPTPEKCISEIEREQLDKLKACNRLVLDE